MTKLFSYKNRSPHLGPYPLERLKRTEQEPDLNALNAEAQVNFKSDNPVSIINAMGFNQPF